jgi:cytochrome c6
VKKIMTTVYAFLIIGGLVTFSLAEMKTSKTGKELFKEHCALCHPYGSNIIHPGKSLRKADLEANNILTKSDIVEKMRHPGKGMSSWSAASLPDKDALEIADYIMKTFNIAEMKSGKTGEELFQEHCALCHPYGSNITHPGKSLRKADLEAHNIMTKSDIVEKMRHPGKGMSSWSAASLPDKDALEIADYIMKTFK